MLASGRTLGSLEAQLPMSFQAQSKMVEVNAAALQRCDRRASTRGARAHECAWASKPRPQFLLRSNT